MAPQKTSGQTQQTNMGLGWMSPALGSDSRRMLGYGNVVGPRDAPNWKACCPSTGPVRPGYPCRSGETGPPATKRASFLWIEGRCDYYNCQFLLNSYACVLGVGACTASETAPPPSRKETKTDPPILNCGDRDPLWEPRSRVGKARPHGVVCCGCSLYWCYCFIIFH